MGGGFTCKRDGSIVVATFGCRCSILMTNIGLQYGYFLQYLDIIADFLVGRGGCRNRYNLQYIAPKWIQFADMV